MAKVHYATISWYDEFDGGIVHEAFSEDADKLANWLQERMQNIAPTWTSEPVCKMPSISVYVPELKWNAETENSAYEAAFGELKLL